MGRRLMSAEGWSRIDGSLEIGGTADHIHILGHLGRSITIADYIEEIKTTSSKWAKSAFGVPEFYWQGGYAIFSVSSSRVDAVQRYIQRQEAHHKKPGFGFKEELIHFLER